MSLNAADYPLPNTWARVGGGIIVTFSIISFISIIFGLIVFFTTPSLRKLQSNYLFLSLLATCLMLSISFGIQGGYVVFTNSWILLSGIACPLTGYLNQMSSSVEVFTLMSMAIERYFAVVKGKPLSKFKVIFIAVFAWLWSAFLTSFPLWIPNLRFSLAASKMYCTTEYWSRDQFASTLPGVVQAFTCITVMIACYLQIYLKFKQAGQQTKHHDATAVSSTTSAKRNTEHAKDLRMLLTTMILAGWTLMGWSCLLMVFFFELFTGNRANSDFHVFGTIAIVLCISGDTIILLVFDKRWNTAAKDLIAKFK